MPDPVRPEDLYLFRWINHLSLDPDGSAVVYEIVWADEQARESRSRIWRQPLGGEQEPVELTRGPVRDHSPRWSPSGDKVTFTSRWQGRDQIFVVAASGGEPRQLSALPDGASQPRWSPDGSSIAFLGSVLADPDAVVDDPRAPENPEERRRPPVARTARRLDYRHDATGYSDGRHRHLFVVPAEGGEARQLTFGRWSVTDFDWAPGGRQLVLAANDRPDADLSRWSRLHIVDLEAGRRLLLDGMDVRFPAWSPAGDRIAFIAPQGDEGGLTDRLWVISPEGEVPQCLTPTLDLNVGDTVITDMRAGHAIKIEWGEGGRRVFFLASGPGRSGLFSSDLEGEVRQELGGARQIYDFDLAQDTIVFLAADPANPGDLHLAREGSEARLTALNPWLAHRYVALPERVETRAVDNLTLEGWLLKPPGFDASRRHPLVLEIHGGPHGQYGWSFFHEFQVLAGMGFVVFYLNPRGSDGYGEAFRRAVVRDWGGMDYSDLMTALDQLAGRGFVDTERMGVGGGSYGGYMTLWMIGQTDRFGAAVAMRSICNLVSEYAQHDIVPWGQQELGDPPWPDPDQLWSRSPIRYVREVRTPLLLTHGEMDLRCAISQADEMFGALRLLGREVELVRFPGESHDFSRSGRPDRRVERLRRIAAWFGGHLLTPKAQAGAAPSQPEPAVADRSPGTS